MQFYNFYNMKKVNHNSQPLINTENPQKTAHQTDLFCQFDSPILQKSSFSKMDFNLKKTTLQLTTNQSDLLQLSAHQLTGSDQQQEKQQTNPQKPNYLSTLWQQIKSGPSRSHSYLGSPKASGWQEMELRKTESSQTQSSLMNSVIFGNKIEDFKLIKLLGTGRFGQVFLAIDKKTGFVGAIKMLAKSEIAKLQIEEWQKMMKQLSNQIKLQAYMNHPNVIKLYTFFHDADNVYLFLELGTDGHLLDLLEHKHHLQEETTSVLVREVTRGVRYMHSKKIIHRDIKLQNIVLTCGMAKICDFGWTIYQAKNLRETICGTPIYLSPQILKGKKYDHKIDIWAIGTLAHQLAVGDNPFQVRRRQDLQKIISKDFEMRVGSIELRSFISFILRKDPQRRPDAEILMKHPFITKYKHIETAQQLCQVCPTSQQ